MVEFLFAAALLGILAVYIFSIKVNASEREANSLAEKEWRLAGERLEYLLTHPEFHPDEGICTDTFVADYLREAGRHVQSNAFCRVSEGGETVSVIIPLRPVESNVIYLFEVYPHSTSSESVELRAGGNAYCYTPDGKRHRKETEKSEILEEIFPRWCIDVLKEAYSEK